MKRKGATNSPGKKTHEIEKNGTVLQDFQWKEQQQVELGHANLRRNL